MRTFITGASGAIGRAIALAFREDELILQANRNAEALRAFVTEHNLNAEIVELDLSDPEAVERVTMTLPVIDRYIHGAGNHYYGLLVDQPWRDAQSIFQVHVLSLMQIAGQLQTRKPFDAPLDIVVISSVWGEVGAAAEVAYSSAKAAQIGFVKSFSKEAGAFRVRVNAVTPGWIETPMNDVIGDDAEALTDIPLGRLGKPEEVAHVVRFLCAPESGYMSGAVIRVDGAWQ